MRLRRFVFAVAGLSALALGPSPAFAAQANDGSTAGLPGAVSPDVDENAAPSDEDPGPVVDYVRSTDGTAAPGDSLDWVAANTPTSTAAVSTLAAKIWAACGIFTDKQKIVATFTRKAMHTTSGAPGYLPAGTSYLKCGSEKWGYNHILKNHLSQWENDASVEGENWRDLADFAIDIALKDPDVVTYRASNDTYCFSREIYLLDKRTGRVVATRYPNVSIAAASKNIITAFPAGAQCR